MNIAARYDSPLGEMTIVSDGTSLTGLWFERQRHVPAPDPEAKDLTCAAEIPVFQQTREWLDTYFSGREPGFTPPLAMHTTPFRKAVWEQLLTIPFGQTMTYGDIARRIGCTSARAVGGAVGHNPIALIIPCHRIIGADRTLTGYAAGIDRKAWLLRLENIDFKKKPDNHSKDESYT